MIKHKTRVQEVATNKPNAATAFDLPTSAATGFRPFAAAYSNTDQLPYHASNGTNWESGIGTFTTGSPNTLVRTAILESSNSDAAVDFSGSASFPTIFVEMAALLGQDSDLNEQSTTPGGRLTIESGVPLSTTNQTAKTTIYYTPYKHNVVVLWDGIKWKPVETSEVSLAIDTLANTNPHDVFGYLSAGSLSLELTAWTSGTARATNISIQDGRYCKVGAKDRLYLGTIWPKTTSTMEDSLTFRGVWNAYNQETKTLYYDAGSSSHTWTSATDAVREYNNASGVHNFKFVNGLPLTKISLSALGLISSSVAGLGVSIYANLDATTTYSVIPGMIPQATSYSTTSSIPMVYADNGPVPVGTHIVTMCDRLIGGTSKTGTFNYGAIGGSILS